MDDPGAAARIFKEFAKKSEHFEVKALAVGGELLGAEQLDRLATLPTREQALALFAAVLQAPVAKFARTLNERSEEHTSELQSRGHLVCRLLLEKKKNTKQQPQ